MQTSMAGRDYIYNNSKVQKMEGSLRKPLIGTKCGIFVPEFSLYCTVLQVGQL